MNLLIIEDDINLNEGLFYAFENDGFNVFKAYTKQEGLNIFNSKNIDFIILDCNLPDGDNKGKVRYTNYNAYCKRLRN